MHFSHDRPDYAFALRAADGQRVKINDRVFSASLAVAPDHLVTDWPVSNAADLTPEDMAPILALQPSVIILGTGHSQVFPPPAVLAHCLSQGVGLEVMNNASAARTYAVLASEARKVVAALILAGA